ncbi:hypothetical protein BFN03_12800 [Rhodococcus sp. WMMA185]|uniref:hypothetical protein n=1 Tax=Rhodococcus sp. WMMA185 TaxID=679318 RepID=UPI000878BD5A|nr:hypothetical protein [Rhodococcus sp. WMMA185]AOW93227.1 hypothetical protein BFN03_12800 [Rhodococcus sp. WMMA185]
MRLRKNEVRGLTAGLVILAVVSIVASVQSRSWALLAEIVIVGLIFCAAALVVVRLLISPKDEQPKKKE